MFKFEGQSVRVVMIEDKPWFVAKDALLCLGCSLENGGAAPYLQHLNMGEDEKRHVLKSIIGPFYGWPNGGPALHFRVRPLQAHHAFG